MTTGTVSQTQIQKHILLRCAALIFSVFLCGLLSSQANASTKAFFPVVSSGYEPGARSVDCWFSVGSDWPRVECYRMQVLESQSKPASRIISFPVVVFRSESTSKKRAPVLHLGAGGPGAPMYLDDTRSVNYFWKTLSLISIDQGRDLLVIDPRGAGLSQPLLTCHQFVDSELIRFQRNLTLSEEIISIDKDYDDCIKDFTVSGIDFSSYNSHSVTNDVEAMRQAADIDKWVLIGVSYGAAYAQAIADRFPESVESMILDSALMLRIGRHENFRELTIAPYLKLFQYCDYDPDCKRPIENIESRFWALHETLNANPISIQFKHSEGAERIPILLNGERFLSSILQGIYGIDIYKDLPYIINELEHGQSDSLLPYLWQHVDYMLDRTYGDVSAVAHYCFEEKPFIDFEKIKSLIKTLPEGYIQDTARLSWSWRDHCDNLHLKNTALSPIPSSPITTPTLFLHGRFDTVTPLSSIIAGQAFFDNNQLLTFDLSHSILTSSPCAVEAVSRYIANPDSSEEVLDCD
jgi:pimeloyl-ACP methyl ester carboxylesterase